MLSCYLKTFVKEFQFRMFISTNTIRGFDQIKAKTLVKLCDFHLTSYSGPPFFICLVFSATKGLPLLFSFPGTLLLLPISFSIFCCWRGSRRWRSSRSRSWSPNCFTFFSPFFPPIVSTPPGACYKYRKTIKQCLSCSTSSLPEFKQRCPAPTAWFTDSWSCQEVIWRWQPNVQFNFIVK